MKVIIVGAGLIGVTTAFFLKRLGYDVTVVERREGPALETSFANGSLLSPGACEPWNAPGSWRHLLRSIGRSDSAMQLRLRALPGLTSWGIKFLRSSTPATYDRSTRSNVRLALYSLQVMHGIRQDLSLDYGRSARGFLRIFRDAAALRAAEMAGERLATCGIAFRRLSAPEAAELEPGLLPIRSLVAGALHYLTDETGDAYRFCVGLAAQAEREGVKFKYRTEVHSIVGRASRATSLKTRNERLCADLYIVAAGSFTPRLTAAAGVRLPVQPVKGYSVTFDIGSNRPPLAVPVVDDHWHAVVTPLPGAIRVAGTAEFAGYDLRMRPERIQNLLNLVREVLPRAALDFKRARPWCGLRPMSADGVPVIGPTPLKNVWVSTGHGPLGWTQAAGSAQLLAHQIAGMATALDPSDFALTRFANRPSRSN